MEGSGIVDARLFNEIGSQEAMLSVRDDSGKVIQRLPLKFKEQTGYPRNFNVLYQDVTFALWQSAEIVGAFIEIPSIRGELSSTGILNRHKHPILVGAGDFVTFAKIGFNCRYVANRDPEIERLYEEREKLRKEKRFEEADAIRDILIERGAIVGDRKASE